VAGQGLRLTLLGVVLGVALSAGSARLVSGLLFGVTPADPVVLLAVVALPLAGLAVSLHPAWRATRIDAAEVLRAG
jgi:putative ABC transport system permease protein